MTYRVIVCGSRKYNWNWRHRVDQYLNLVHAANPELLVVVGGCYSGADAYASSWAASNKVPCHTYFADWEGLGPSAGPIRNSKMLEDGAEQVAAFWLPSVDRYDNRGTRDLCAKAHRAGIPVLATWGDSEPVVWHEKLFKTVSRRA